MYWGGGKIRAIHISWELFPLFLLYSMRNVEEIATVVLYNLSAHKGEVLVGPLYQMDGVFGKRLPHITLQLLLARRDFGELLELVVSPPPGKEQ